MKTVFFRVLEAENKAVALLEAIRKQESAIGRQRFELEPERFASIPRSPFAYWVSERASEVFSRLPKMEDNGRTIKVGVQTFNDPRFLRLSWEVSICNDRSKWFLFAKGGSHSPYYSDVHLLVNFFDTGREIAAFKYAHRPREGLQHRAVEYYVRPGLTWPRRTSGLSMRVMPAGCVFADKGPALFVENDEIGSLLALACITNSRAFRFLVSLQLARTELAQSYEVGLIQTTPVPDLTASDQEALAGLARRAWSLKRWIDTRTETSHAFSLPALLQVSGADIAARTAAWSEHVRAVETELAALQTEIDQRCFVLFGIDEADCRAMTENFAMQRTEEALSDSVNDAEDDAEEDADENDSNADATGLAADLASWAMGVVFGRFDLRLATGVRPLPTEPEPFNQLPACSPGILTGDGAMQFTRPSSDYPMVFPETGVLVDDAGHAGDLTAAVRVVFDVVFGVDADRWWNDVASLLDPKGHDLRVWLASSFFEHHLRRYSKSRRKAPIIWQIAVPSGRYSVWLYAHRLSRDSFIQIQNDVVTPKLAHEERQLASLMQSAGADSNAKERKEIEAQEALVEELRELLDKVKRVAPLWHPSLDDGVALTMAPLWRLVPQHKPWQKELKSMWDEMVAGKSDWAHIAMHLWPERVIPKCAEDRSLAIAHGLEDVFWLEDEDGKWKPREKPQKSIANLVSEHASTAVKAALKSLLDAPEPASGTKRNRKPKAA